MSIPRRPLAERFWSHVQKDDGDACWFWQAAIDRSTGYGSLGAAIGRRTLLAHRLSWMLAHGEIPAGLNVCHKCDTPACVRPDHLFLGTAKENSQDMVAKGRHYSILRPELVRRGEQVNTAKLHAGQVLEIRARLRMGEKQRDLAKVYGVSRAMIGYIKRGDSWKHLGEG